MKSIILIAIIAVVVSPIHGEEAVESKKQEKRGLLGLGYGGYYSGLGYSGLGYGGYGHLASPLLSVNHGILPAYTAHSSPVVTSGYHGSIYNSPLRLGYPPVAGLAGLAGLGHGLNYNYNYLHGGHIY